MISYTIECLKRILVNCNGIYHISHFYDASMIWVSLCLSQSFMFAEASDFNQDIGGWDVSKGTNFVSDKTINAFVLFYRMIDKSTCQS